MKKLFTLVVILMSLTVNTFGSAVYFQNPTVEFLTGSEPTMVDGHKYYQQDVWWVDDNGGSMSLGWAQADFIWAVDVTGNLTIAEGHYITKSGTHYELPSSDVFFDGSTGTITITATNPNHDGVAYSCSYTIIYHVQASSKKWDFNSTEYHLRGNHWDGYTSHMGSNNNSPEYHKYGNPIHNVNGGEYVQEAEGLFLYAKNGYFGGNNPSGNTPVEGRYLCFANGSSFTIPHSWFDTYSNPRVRIKMARYGDNTMNLTISNAKDALGKLITGPYKIGGSQWWGSKGDNNYRGEYHFFINNKNSDFTVKVESGWGNWLMLLTVEVYDSPEIKTENDVLGSCYQYLNWEGGTAAEGDFYLHFRGKAEQSKVDANSISTTGNVTCNSTNLSDMGGSSSEKHHYKSTVGEYGTFRFRLDCYTHDGQYVTDYAWRTHSVGYMQKRSYPYTWDFTDVKTHYANGMQAEDNYTASAANVYSYDNRYNPVARNLWGKDDNGNYGLQLAADGAHDVHYCGGSQLWYGNTIIPELQYLAFTPVNFDKAYNNAMTITDGGLKFDQNLRDWWLWRIMIPEVPTNAVIYVRAHQDRTGDFYNVGYYYGDATNKTEKSTFSTEELTATVTAREVAVVNDNSGDVIYAIPAPSTTTNVTLFFQGVTVRKIGVSVDPKAVNSKGWTSESRNHDIDAALIPYFTGKSMKTYFAGQPNYKNRTLVLTDVGSSVDNHVMPANTGCVIFNATDEKKVDMMGLNDGFHLFVPDMHDTEKLANAAATVGNAKVNMLKPQLKEKNPMQRTESVENIEHTVYVLSYKFYQLDANSNANNSTAVEGPEMFYRIPADKTIGLRANSAYLLLPTDDVKPQGASSAKYSFIFADYDDFVFDSFGGIATGVETIEAAHQAQEGWYTINGQKLSGRPTTSGLYIVNGKKVLVK